MINKYTKKIISDSHKCFCKIKQTQEGEWLGVGAVLFGWPGEASSEKEPAVWRSGS